MKNNNKTRGDKILIVDDSPESIDILANTLPSHYKCQVFLSGIQALEILASSNDMPDLILLDVMMPDMNGYEVCKHIKNDVRLRDIPIIFISAKNDTFDKVKAFKLGGADYITKPFQPEEVVARVGAHLEIANSRKEIRDLYSETLQGTISTMNDMLTMANPEVSKICNRMRLYAELIMNELVLEDFWDLKLACLLSGIGMLKESMEKRDIIYFTDRYNAVSSLDVNVSFDINKAYESLSLSVKVIENIPKLEPVVKLIRESMLPLEKKYKNVSLSDVQPDILKSHILRILIHYCYIIKREKNYILVLKRMRNNKNEFYIQEILDVLNKIQNKLSNTSVVEIYIDEIKPNMILAEDICSLEGNLLLKSGHKFSESLITLLKNIKQLENMKIKIINKFTDIE